jgi:hypothetical protein
MFTLRKTFHLAKEMGKKLGAGSLLQRTLQAGEHEN